MSVPTRADGVARRPVPGRARRTEAEHAGGDLDDVRRTNIVRSSRSRFPPGARTELGPQPGRQTRQTNGCDIEDTITRTRKMTTELCPRCRFHPASPRIAGYCSWDCYEADEEDANDEDEEVA